MGTTDMSKTEYQQIDFSTLQDVKNFELVYHNREDTLFVRPPERAYAGTSVDWSGEIWIRVDPQNGRIVGLEIDDFETIFLKKHPELSKAWEAVKPSRRQHRLRARNDQKVRESFGRILFSFLISLLNSQPQQFSLGAVQ